ncbi:NAD-dependent epimerase/dehydratase family protein [Desulfosediminicola sp.]|uniref:NAD-dependent epimerase/dehydratase family protein n=1 Tax=Desulfosediminicola sp. TaxID=2886825 RepID=UPI003AF2BF85
MPEVMVTGSTGFIGQHLTKRLFSLGFQVTALTRSNGDISDSATWDALKAVETVVHLAANTFVPDSWQKPNSYLKTNLTGTILALEYCRRHGANFVYLSSYLYGNPEELPIPEASQLIASNPYALSKKLAEDVCRFYAENFGVKVTILRPFNVFGPGQSGHFLIPSIIDQINSDTVITVQDLEPKRDYVYVDDLVEAIVLAMRNRRDFDVFNIGTGQSYSVQDLIQIIQDIKGTALAVKAVGKRRHGEVMDTRADISRAKSFLNWEPQFSLKSGLASMLISRSSFDIVS